MKFGLSYRKHLPVIKVGTNSFPLWDYNKIRFVEKTNLQLDSYAFSILTTELKIFKYYLPNFSLKGLTVLDVGACCGETAWYFFKHGAKKVVCIEILEDRVKMIEANKKTLGLNIDVVGEAFKPEHLQIPHDFIKVDIEGAETLLLPYVSSLKPCVVEAHGEVIKKQFEDVGFKFIFQINPVTFLLSNI
jgi:predicted rRNA methylase YqxC with S4 and FtsJ domains